MPLASFANIRGDCLKPDNECSRLVMQLTVPDITFVGIGEMVTINDPPADLKVIILFGG